MSASNVISKNFGNFKGLDLRSSDLQRGDGYCSEMLNCIQNKANVMSKRKGYQQKATSVAGRGMTVFANLNSTTNTFTEEILTVGETLYKVVQSTLRVTYTGIDVAYLSILFVSGAYTLSITINQSEVLGLSLGKGRNEITPVNLNAVVTAINLLSGFSASVIGTGTIPAAFLLAQEYNLLVSTVAQDLIAHSSVAVNSPQAIMLPTTQTYINDDSFINASMVNARNVLFIGTGYDDLLKYDGQNLYKAGVPAPTAPTAIANATVTTINNSALKHLVTYIQKDAKGNIIEGIPSITAASLNIMNVGINVTVTNLLAASGFNTNCGVVNGNQTTVTTLTLASGHTLKVGDTAYFYNAVSVSYVERLISAITATTIVIAGAAVTITNNAVISNNLRIAIYRNNAAGTTFSLTAEIPNNSLSATQLHIDIKTDANLGAEYIPPIKPHGLPPKGRFLNFFRNQLFIADNLNTVNYSDIDSPEYFPPGDNGFDVFSNRGDNITGLGSLPNVFVVFKSKSIHAASGDFTEDAFRLDQVNKGEIGCVAHHTIQEVNGSLFFLSEKGVFSITNSSELTELSYNIEPEFTKPQLTYNLKKAVAINWLFQDLYLVLLPTEATTGANKYLDNNSSSMFAYDYVRSSWYQWDNVNCLGGMILYQNVAWFTERAYSSVLGTPVFGVFKFNNTGSYLDYIDHDAAIVFSYSSPWEAGGQPSLYKKFLRLKLYSLEGDYKDGEIIPFSVVATYQFDFVPNNIGTSSLNFTGGGLGYGDDAYSDDAYGSSNLLEVVARLPSTKCRSLRLILSNSTLLENILISGYEFEIVAPFKGFIKE